MLSPKDFIVISEAIRRAKTPIEDVPGDAILILDGSGVTKYGKKQ